MKNKILIAIVLSILIAAVFYLGLAFIFNSFDISKYPKESKGFVFTVWVMASGGLAIGMLFESDKNAQP